MLALLGPLMRSLFLRPHWKTTVLPTVFTSDSQEERCHDRMPAHTIAIHWVADSIVSKSKRGRQFTSLILVDLGMRSVRPVIIMWCLYNTVCSSCIRSRSGSSFSRTVLGHIGCLQHNRLSCPLCCQMLTSFRNSFNENSAA